MGPEIEVSDLGPWEERAPNSVSQHIIETVKSKQSNKESLEEDQMTNPWEEGLLKLKTKYTAG